jgi:hypothetical protein
MSLDPHLAAFPQTAEGMKSWSKSAENGIKIMYRCNSQRPD